MFGQHGKMGGVSSFEVLKQLGDLPWISSMIPPSEARNATCDSTKMKREVKFQPTKTFHPPQQKTVKSNSWRIYVVFLVSNAYY